MPPGRVLAGAALVAAATMAGAWLPRRRPAHRDIWFAATAGALLIIAGLHLLPDAWSDARAEGIWPSLVPLAAVATFTAAGLAIRAGCGCRPRTEPTGGASTAAALAIHRLLEGSAVALAGSVAIAAALAVHAFGEGMATSALLGSQPRRRAARWVALMCVTPVVGATLTGALTVPESAGPFLIAATAGILAQAAMVSLRVAFQGLPPTRLLLSHPAAATTTAAVLTAVAVHAAG
jgi:ZIP family zinc transporter